MRYLRWLVLVSGLFPTVAIRADEVVLPVAIYAFGANQSLFATEIRVTNSTGADLALHVIDFIGDSGNLSFSPGHYTMPAGQIRAFGAYNLLSPALADCHGLACTVGDGWTYFGAFVIDVDPGIFIQAAILTGSSANVPKAGPEMNAVCGSWEGGNVTGDGPAGCVEGAGPLLENTGDFRTPTTSITLSWLHTQPSRRTNVTFYNPDPVPATVTLKVTAADGRFTAMLSITVPAHALAQLNDIFSVAPFDAIRSHNGTTTAAASATITSSTRLYAIGWVISNENNTVTISVPK